MQMPGWVLTGIGAVIGLVTGSYLTVLVARVPAGENVLRPPGRCDGCAARLPARDMIPVASWLVLRGHCRTCRAGIGGWHLVAELVTAAGFALMALRFGFSPVLPAFWFLPAAGVALAMIDLRHQRLPDLLTLPAYPASLLLLGVAALLRSAARRPVIGALAGMAAALLLFLLLALIAPAGIGGGDVKLAGVRGLSLGWLGAPAVAAGMFGAFALAAVAGAGLIATGRATRKSQLAFGPFLLGATLAVIMASGVVPVIAW